MYRGLPFLLYLRSVTLITGALAMGWTTHVGTLQVQGLWITQEAILHINILGLRAIFYACWQFLSHIKGSLGSHQQHHRNVLFEQKSGARSSNLCQKAVKLQNWCIQSSVTLKA